MTKFSMVFHCYCHTYPSHFPQKKRLFFMECFSLLYPRSRYSLKQKQHKASTYHHSKYRFTLIIKAIESKHHRKSDEKACQSKNLTNNLQRKCHTNDEKTLKVATKNHGNSDETSWQSKNSPTTYDIDAIHAAKKCGKVR
jgi:hypothetical protein